jgi:PTH1 family peptidyl-tRNA hydrolase
VRLRRRTELDVNDDDTWLVVGLGNPGPTYAGHRHNVGYLVVDELARRMGGSLRAHKSGRAGVLEGRLAPPGAPAPKVVLGRARGYMNESGGGVSTLTKFYGVAPDHLVVVHDELDLAFDTMRIKLGGGEGGHNGLRSISRSLGTKDYLRVRVGIGRPPGRMDPADFVLRDFSAVERKELPVTLEDAADAVELLVERGLLAAQNHWH